MAGDANSSAATPTFEEALARLETVTLALEEGRIGLAESLACYEEGIKLLRQCYGLLEKAEQRIELLSRVSVAGEATTEPFGEPSQSLEEKTAQRSRRRSRKPAAAESPSGVAGGAEAPSPASDMPDPSSQPSEATGEEARDDEHPRSLF